MYTLSFNYDLYVTSLLSVTDFPINDVTKGKNALQKEAVVNVIFFFFFS